MLGLINGAHSPPSLWVDNVLDHDVDNQLLPCIIAKKFLSGEGQRRQPWRERSHRSDKQKQNYAKNRLSTTSRTASRMTTWIISEEDAF